MLVLQVNDQICEVLGRHHLIYVCFVFEHLFRWVVVLNLVEFLMNLFCPLHKLFKLRNIQLVSGLDSFSYQGHGLIICIQKGFLLFENLHYTEKFGQTDLHDKEFYSLSAFLLHLLK